MAGARQMAIEEVVRKVLVDEHADRPHDEEVLELEAA
jgi:hypothetical protein